MAYIGVSEVISDYLKSNQKTGKKSFDFLPVFCYSIVMTTTPVFDIRNLSFTWDKPKAVRSGTARYVITGFNAQLCSRQIITLIGRNGSGKSTLLKILSGLNRRYDGDVFFCGQQLSGLRRSLLARNMSYMSQSSDEMPPFTVREIADMGNYAGLSGIDARQADERTMMALGLTGLTDKADIPYSQLSGGYQQRVMLARAICQSVNVMLLDEPMSGLDIVCKDSMMRTLRHITDTQDSLIMMSTHDIDLAKRYSDHILCFAGHTPQMLLPSELTDEKIEEIFREE